MEFCSAPISPHFCVHLLLLPEEELHWNVHVLQSPPEQHSCIQLAQNIDHHWCKAYLKIILPWCDKSAILSGQSERQFCPFSIVMEINDIWAQLSRQAGWMKLAYVPTGLCFQHPRQIPRNNSLSCQNVDIDE